MNRRAVAILVLAVTFLGKLGLSQEQPDVTERKTNGHIAQINGIKMYYEIHGEGEPLVLVHGFLGSAANWKPYIALSAHLDLIFSEFP